jgi:hypothetical protein
VDGIDVKFCASVEAIAPDDAFPNWIACRAYDPPDTSFAPVFDGDPSHNPR